jgi:RND family efflux transporter MFP subunit
MFRRPSVWLGVLATIVLVAVGGLAVSRMQVQKARAEAAARSHPLDTPYAAIASGKADVEGGVINVAARTAGVIRDVYVQEGDTVHKGQVLARLEDDPQRLAASTASAALAQARAQVAAIQVQQRAAEREFARLERLAPSNFVAAQALDKAQDDLATAQAAQQTQQAAITTAQAQLDQARYNLELTYIRAPADGKIVRRYANPGAGASTLNVSTMFDLEPDTARIVRAEIAESALPAVNNGQEVELTPEADESKVYVGRVLRRAEMFGARKLQSDDPSEKTDERVVEVVVSADSAPFLIGQRVLVKFMKPGRNAEGQRAPPPRQS